MFDGRVESPFVFESSYFSLLWPKA